MGFVTGTRGGESMDRGRSRGMRTCSSPTSMGKTSTPAQIVSASRWVIDFNDRSEAEAQYVSASVSSALVERVKPERREEDRRRDGSSLVAVLPDTPRLCGRRSRGWMRCLSLRGSARPSCRCACQLGRCSATRWLSSRLTRIADQAVLSSSMHQMWAIKYGSTMRTRSELLAVRCVRDVPAPEPTDRLARGRPDA